jgi:transposase
MGDTGSYALVAAYAHRLRQAQGPDPDNTVHGRPSRSSPSADEARQLDQLQAQQAEVTEATDLVQDSGHLVRQRQSAQLNPWLQRATSTLEALQRFATELYEAYDAVKAGVTLPWEFLPRQGAY